MPTPLGPVITNATLDSPILPPEAILVRIDRLLNIATSSTLIVLSVIGNVSSILILGRKSFCRMPMSVYLRFLALMDMGTVITGMIPRLVLAVADYDVRHTNDLSCIFQVYIVYVLTELSAWTLVIVTSERVLSILKPHKVKLVCTKRRSLVILTSTVFFFTMVNMPIFFLFGITHSNIKTRNPSSNRSSINQTGIYSNSTYTFINNTIPPMNFTNIWKNYTKAFSNFTGTTPSVLDQAAFYKSFFGSASNRTLVDSRRCVLMGSESTKEIWYLTHFAKQSLLPFVILFTLNIVIIVSLIRRRNTLLKMSAEETEHRRLSKDSDGTRTKANISKRMFIISQSRPSQNETNIFSSDALDAGDADSQSTRSGDSGISIDSMLKTKSSRNFSCLKFWRRGPILQTNIYRDRSKMGPNNIRMRAASKRGKVRAKLRHKDMASRRDVSLSVMLVTVNAVFLVCTFPIGIYQQIVPNLPVPSKDSPEQNLLFTCLVFVLYLNNTLNFVLYCVSGSRFRDELKTMFVCLKRKTIREKTFVG